MHDIFTKGNVWCLKELADDKWIWQFGYRRQQWTSPKIPLSATDLMQVLALNNEFWDSFIELQCAHPCVEWQGWFLLQLSNVEVSIYCQLASAVSITAFCCISRNTGR